MYPATIHPDRGSLDTIWFYHWQDVLASDKNLRYFVRPSSSCPEGNYGTSQLSTVL